MFDKIDDYFREKKPSEVALIGILIVALIGFLVYSYLFPSSEKYLRTNQNNLNSITQKLNDETRYLASMKVGEDQQFHVKRLEQEIVQQNEELVLATHLNGYVDNKLKELSYLLFDDKNWAKFLDSIATIGKKYNLDIIEISNEFNKPTLQKIEQILNIHVKTEGNYHSTMKFINAIEESQLIVDIHSIELEGKRNIEGKMDIAVWGMKY